MVKILWF